MKRWSLLLGGFACLGWVSCCVGGAEVNAPAGPVALTVELPHPQQQILYVHEVVPVRPGPLTLLYPKFIPGDHAPDGPINEVMGIEITSAGKRVPWSRDAVDMFTLHLNVPANTDRIQIAFQFPARNRITPN